MHRRLFLHLLFVHSADARGGMPREERRREGVIWMARRVEHM